MTKSARKPAAVAYILPRLEMGGTEKHVRDLVSRLDRSRFAPLVIATSEGGVLEAEFARMDVPVHVIGYKEASRRIPGGAARLPAAWSAVGTTAGILRRTRAALVHACLPAANVFGAIAGTLARTPRIIVGKRALCRYKQGRPTLSLLEDLANLLANAVLVNSRAVAEEVRRHERFLGRKIRLVYNGVDGADTPPEPSAPLSQLCPEFSPPPGAAAVLCVANLFRYKGHADLVEAARIVAGAHPDVRFLLVGRDAGEEEALRARIAALGLARHVHLAGPRDDVPALMAAADLLVHPSHEEGFSNVILETMAAGKAVVATAVGGIPEAVVDGETGILVPPRDPERLAGAVLSLLRDPERARAMGSAGRRRVLAHFPLKGMVREIEEMYEDLLSGGRR
jgi:glycosyltransferase involved in cell wall biosynthesis